MGPGFLLVTEDTKIKGVVLKELQVWKRWTHRNCPPTEDWCPIWRHAQFSQQGCSAFPGELRGLLEGAPWELNP